jgi:anti-sigma regulatory factor (Ser/Thr protein kinase)/anti-anti-sigma regulatory factor
MRNAAEDPSMPHERIHVNQAQQIGTSPLSVHVSALSPYVVGRWVGSGQPSAGVTARQAVGELLARSGASLVLDLSQLHDISDEVVEALNRGIAEAQRRGRTVCLVRCPAELYRRLQVGGLAGTVSHSGSLVAATQGMFGEPTSTLDLYLRSVPEMLHRVRSVISIVAHEAALSDRMEMDLKTAVTEAAANAIRHGSPEGARNHIRVSFHLEPGMLIVDVADQGPGFDPTALAAMPSDEPQEHGYGLHMIRATTDRLEFFRDERGMLVRMTKLLGR